MVIYSKVSAQTKNGRKVLWHFRLPLLHLLLKSVTAYVPSMEPGPWFHKVDALSSVMPYGAQKLPKKKTYMRVVLARNIEGNT